MATRFGSLTYTGPRVRQGIPQDGGKGSEGLDKDKPYLRSSASIRG
jgi:hypothetical protein